MLRPCGSSLRIALVGECNVGKTTIVRRFIGKQVNDDTKMTIGVDKYEKTLNFGCDNYNLTLLDMSGGLQFQTIVESYLACVDAVVFVYDVADRESFATLPLWNSLVEKSTRRVRKTVKILVGNKKDLAKYCREVPFKTARNFSNFEGMVYLEVSAKMDDNIELIFQCLTQEIMARRATEIDKLNTQQRRTPVEWNRLSFAPFVKNLKTFFSKKFRFA